ncbi:alpha/beta hydrolase [Gordonia sp. X0973]|uniref:alpha/beta hydrolase n=1 Tax=Gordonia sp. X0973 TaxID=2742602 RepID=UPI000F529C97|nr:alpha/beta hydrolase [Gordonia sp. X0973]QKT08952.1 alpha/beta hydrolase [Gordonia sp. X0973]
MTRVVNPAFSLTALGTPAILTAMRPVVNQTLNLASPVPTGTRTETVRRRRADGEVRGEWVWGPGVGQQRIADTRVIYYLHGSGYVICNPRTHRGLVSRLSRRTGHVAFSLDYRLAPKHRFPAAGDDTARGYEWLLDQGYRPENIVVAGDSAGGHLAMDLLADNQSKSRPQPRAMVLFSPLMDPTFGLAMAREARGLRDPIITAKAGRHFLDMYTGGAPANHPRMTVSLKPSGDLPRTLIQAGGREVMSDDARFLHAALIAAGASSELQLWPDQGHVFQMFPLLTPESRQAVQQAARFVCR